MNDAIIMDRLQPLGDEGSWWSGIRPSPEVADRLAATALIRTQIFLPVVLFAIVVALLVSEPSGIPLTAPILVVNGIVFTLLVVCAVQLRRAKIPLRWAHAAGALVWVATPINTLVSTGMVHSPQLTLPLMIELASLALLVETRWALAVSVPVVLAAFPLMARSGTGGVYPIAVVGVWIVAMIMQIALRRSMIHAETNRVELTTALESLRRELDERARVEREREALRDQFIHAQRMEAVGTLAAGLAHDMNNILGGILAFAEILRHEAKDTAVQADLDRIRQEAERGAALTRSLLAFSRRGAYRRTTLSVGSVLDDMQPLLSRTLGKGIRLERIDGPLAIVDGDAAQLGQVLLNLCLNASDAMNGEGKIVLRTDVTERDGKNYAHLSVADTGAGMDESTRSKIFEPFFTTKPVGKGTGLGLAMVYGAIEAHGGSIEVQTKVGSGTTIHIYLPTTEATPVPFARPTTPRAIHRGTVLIVDDEATMRAGASRMIEQLGLEPVGASNGEEALAKFAEHRDDVALVLLDMAMPVMDGATCFHELRKQYNVPILLMTGYTDHTAAKALLRAGANGFLEKPYTAEQLADEVHRILGRTGRATP